MIERIPMLSIAECDAIAERVLGLDSFFSRRHDDLPSFTLGGAAYLDITAGGFPRYLITKSRGNKVLRRHFGELLERVASVLSSALGKDAFLTSRFALPGFHIFRHHPGIGRLAPVLHFDLQDYDLEIAGERRAMARRSFTVAVRMPKAGAGIEIWDLWHHEVADLPFDEARRLGAERRMDRHAYVLGELFLHTGDQLHQIDDSYPIEPGDDRITLQGHAIETDRGFEVYW
jgi:hypothetical protein